MKELVLIDGNSIMNRAFYGIMGSKMLTTPDGRYTNAVYGFLSIMFKIIDDLKPEYMVVTFDLKAPTARHKLYAGYKATRKGMPNELAEQMPIIKNILKAMNITIIEKEGYEADDVLGTLANYGEEQGIHVTILSGDRDTFQLTTNNITIRIPHTKAGKTETEDFKEQNIIEKYGVMPKQLIEVKGLMGDSSDNIPGVPGIGEKTALELIKKYGSIENLYKQIEEGKDELKGKTREKIEQNKELAYLSKELGTINTQVPIEKNLEDYKITEWNKNEVLEIFKELKFNRFIERFGLKAEKNESQIEKLFEIQEVNYNLIEEYAQTEKKIIYTLGKEQSNNDNDIIKKKIISISIYNIEKNVIYYAKTNEEQIKKIFESENIEKYGHNLIEDYVILRQNGIMFKNMVFDIEIAAYLVNPTNSKYNISILANQYLNIDMNDYLEKMGIDKNQNKQITLFETQELNDTTKYGGYKSLSSSKMSVVTFTKKGKVYKNILSRKIMYDKQISDDEEYLKKILGDVSNPKSICDLYLNQKIEYDGGIYLLYTSNENKNKLKMAYQNYMDNNDLFYLNHANKKVNDFKDDALEYKIKDKNDNLIVTISKQENEIIFNKIKDLLNNKIYDSCNYLRKLRDLDNFSSFNIKDQINIINNLIVAMSRNSEKSNLMSYYKEAGNAKLLITKDITKNNIKIIYESPTGLFVKKKKI